MTTYTAAERIARLIAIRDELDSLVPRADRCLYGNFIEHLFDYVTDAEISAKMADVEAAMR